jgi:predicted nucleotidyltransferase
LVGDYGAKRVYVFGSLTREGRLGEHSDIAPAVEGLPPELYLRALGRFLRESPRPVDLVELEDCPAHLRERVLTEGELLEEV